MFVDVLTGKEKEVGNIYLTGTPSAALDLAAISERSKKGVSEKHETRGYL
jgi:hypothetical protein